MQITNKTLIGTATKALKQKKRHISVLFGTMQNLKN